MASAGAASAGAASAGAASAGTASAGAASAGAASAGAASTAGAAASTAGAAGAASSAGWLLQAARAATVAARARIFRVFMGLLPRVNLRHKGKGCSGQNSTRRSSVKTTGNAIIFYIFKEVASICRHRRAKRAHSRADLLACCANAARRIGWAPTPHPITVRIAVSTEMPSTTCTRSCGTWNMSPLVGFGPVGTNTV